MMGSPRHRSEAWEALDREIGQPGKNAGQVVTHWEFKPATAFYDRQNCRNLGSRLWTADVDPVLPAPGHGDALNFPRGYCSAQVPDIPSRGAHG